MKIEEYELHLDVNDSEYSYSGREKIFLEAEDETLVLNSVGLEIRRILVNGEESRFYLKEAAEELLIEGQLRGNQKQAIRRTPDCRALIAHRGPPWGPYLLWRLPFLGQVRVDEEPSQGFLLQ